MFKEMGFVCRMLERGCVPHGIDKEVSGVLKGCIL